MVARVPPWMTRPAGTPSSLVKPNQGISGHIKAKEFSPLASQFPKKNLVKFFTMRQCLRASGKIVGL